MSNGAQRSEKHKKSTDSTSPRSASQEEQGRELEKKAADAFQRALAKPPPSPSDLIALQKAAGNQSVSNLLRDRRGKEGSLPGPTIQRLGVFPFLRPGAAAAPTALASTPATQVEALPAEVQRAHQEHVTAGRFQEALDLVAQAMGRAGQINRLLLQTMVHPTRPPAACQGTACFVIDEGVQGAFTSFCGRIAVGDRNLPNPRIRFNPSIVRSLPRLQSTLLHEMRHVEQEYAQINQAGTAASSGGHRLNCNDPGEIDAYLSEVEHAYSRGGHILEAFARAFVTNEYLAPEQQAVFRARLANAQAKVDRLYGTTIEWSANQHVRDYRAACESLIASYERRVQRTEPNLTRPFYYHHPMAPLNDDTPRAGTRGAGSD